jgi:nucleoside-diphosphate-sugar epimerase
MPKRPHHLPTLAVTGGTGFVGAHLIATARQAGHPVRALTRKWRPFEDGVEWVEGALDRPDSLRRLAEGSDAVIHVAGAINAADRAEFEAVNAGGTAAVIDAARAVGVRRFVHISSLSAREPELSNYGWSKAKSERIVAASSLDWTIIRPPAIYGPGDRETLDLFRMAKRGLVALPPGGRFSVIHVDDLCRLILAVLDHDDSRGATYEPDDGTPDGWAHDDFARALGAALGRRRTRTIAAPRRGLLIAARFDRLFRGRKAKLTSDRARYFSHPDWVAARDKHPPPLLWRPQVGTEAGLKATADWYLSEGWIR